MIEKTFFIQTFGCQMNARDSAWLASALRERGFEEAGASEAQVYILNTCSVREKPEKKVKDAILRFHAQSRGERGRLVAVLGCVAQQCAEALFDVSPQVRLVAGADGVAESPAEIERLLAMPEEKRCLTEFCREYPEREKCREKALAGSAYVNIMQGCDNFCAYCIVPFTRGRQKSRAFSEIIGECEAFLDNGATELTLLGQNVNAYGKGGGHPGFDALLKELTRLPGLKRLRFITPHPADMDEKVINLFGELEVLCPRLHLPLQSGADAVLARMRRRYDRSAYIRLVERLKQRRPDLALSTDIIVGFPGESEDNFQDTLSLMRECGFMSSYSFCYSDRPGTRASIMPGKIAAPVMARRLATLQALQDELSKNWLESRTGQKASILLEAPAPRQNDGKTWRGRDEYGVTVHVEAPEGYPGMYMEAEIGSVKKHTLMAFASKIRPGH